LVAFTTAMGLTVAAQQSAAPSARTAALTQAIPADPQITIGTLPNGLRYYIRANGKPEQRAELRLAVNAGSILEDDDQQGLAHFVEHMAFNGTKHFPKQDVVSFMQSIGMQFGAHVNAYTSFDETVYMLQVPTDKRDVLDKAFLILEDWAQAVTFDPAEVDKERGVVVEEWRLGRGAGTRMMDKQLPVLLNGSRYAQRIPIGKKDILDTFKADRLKKFYADWYRPDLMAVVAVGDFDKAAIETMIKSHFGSIPKPATPKPRQTFSVPDHPGTLYTIATDKEAPNASVSVYNLLPMRDPTTVGAYRRQIVENIFASMLSTRFQEIAQKPDAPFLGAGTGRGLFVRSREATTLSAMVKENEIDRGLQAMYTEAERVARFGFTETEFDREKKNTLRSLEQAVLEKDKQESSSYAAEYIRNFLQKEPIPGIVYENELYQRFVPQITLAEINSLAKEWSPEGNRVVVVNAPEKPGLKIPDQARLAEVMKASTEDLKPYVDSVASTPLLATPPAPGTIVKTTPKPEFGITEWQLSNGVRVVLKPTDFKQDEIVFRAYSFGGTSLASDADYVPATTASQVVYYGGLGAFGMIELQKQLAGKVAGVTPYIGSIDEGVSGGGSAKDAETLFQLIYLTFTQPRADPQIFGVITSQMKAMLANQQAQPETAFNETLQTTIYQNHLRARPLTPAIVDEMNLEKSMAFYKDRFADASDFTFVFVGSFQPETLKPLVEQYLGGLPSTNRRETWKDVNMRPAKGVVEKVVKKGVEPKSQTSIVFTGPFVHDQAHRVEIRAMAAVLENRLRDVLREELGGTYSVSVGASYSKIPVQDYSIEIDFGANPTRVDELVKSVFKEIEAMKASGPTDKQVADVKETMLREFETSTKQNGYLLTNILARYENGEDLKDFYAIPDFYKALSPAIIQSAAKKYLDVNNYVKVTLLPEK
jgi:zinc protease